MKKGVGGRGRVEVEIEGLGSTSLGRVEGRDGH